MTATKPARAARPRRSHALGACRTCRRRHVKCDQKRPSCRTCRALGVTCEGFSDEVRWMRSSDDNSNPDVARHGTRRHLYTEHSRASMSKSLGSDLVSGSIDASLAEIDSKSRDPDRASSGEIIVGPFSVLEFPSSSQDTQSLQVQQPSHVQEMSHGPPSPEPTPTAILSDPAPVTGVSAPSPMSSMVDSLAQMDDFLHWSDLLGISPDQNDFSMQPALDMGQLSGIGARASALDFGVLNTLSENGYRDDGMVTLPQDRVDLESEPVDVLADARFLLKHFQDNIISQMMPIPLEEKPPWKILNVPGAVVTFSDLTFLESQNISHARMANLFAILACSAAHLVLKPVSGMVASVRHWQCVADQAFQQAKNHMQISLERETQQPKRSKYKDQLMAICGLTEYAVLTGQQHHARCFMVDAERLLRVRGLPKRRISQKARLLHHVYTWLRIVGESTYVLHDYSPSTSFLEALDSDFRPRRPAGAEPTVSEPNPRLDDFLRLDTRQSDNDLNIDEPKDKEIGLQDIHLQDSRCYCDTLYKQVYGIPETWLSLVSQTTRLANVIETFRAARKSCTYINLEAWDTLHRRSVRLENMICSFNLGRTRNGVLEQGDSSTAHGHMLKALNAALVIFFYRRIREAHPSILEGHVDSVVSALNEFNAALPPDSSTGPGTAWPAFIAGCEAITPSRREAIMQWFDRADSMCGFVAFQTGKKILTELWKMQDEHLATNRGDPIPTWIDVARQNQIWPLFC